MALIRVAEETLDDPKVKSALMEFFDSFELIDHDKYRRTKDYRVTGDGVPEEDRMLTVKIYYPDGIKPFVIEIE